MLITAEKSITQPTAFVLHAGPMKSRKTTALFEALEDLSDEGVKSAIFKPTTDAGREGLFARGIPKEDLGRYKCGLADTLGLIPVEQLVRDGITHLFVDEAQMFGFRNNEIVHSQLREMLAWWGKCGLQGVIMAGLDYAGRGEPFSFYNEVVELGLPVVHHVARCEHIDEAGSAECGGAAIYTQLYSISQGRPFRHETLPWLLPENTPGLEDLGFRPVCESHFFLDASHMISFTDHISQ